MTEEIVADVADAFLVKAIEGGASDREAALVVIRFLSLMHGRELPVRVQTAALQIFGERALGLRRRSE